MDFVTRGENSTPSPLVRSPLINETFQKLLDSATSTAPESYSSSSSPSEDSGTGAAPMTREKLMDKLVEEIVAKENARLDFVTTIRPDLHQAILDITAHYGWRNVIYLFHSNEGKLTLKLTLVLIAIPFPTYIVLKSEMYGLIMMILNQVLVWNSQQTF